MATDYGKRLKLARKHAGLTQVALSKKTGIAQSTISSAEVGGMGSSDTAAYAQACGVSAIWLSDGEGEMEDASLIQKPPMGRVEQKLPPIQTGGGQLQALFDMIPVGSTLREPAYNACFEILMKAMRESQQVASPPTADTVPVQTQERRSAARQ